MIKITWILILCGTIATGTQQSIIFDPAGKVRMAYGQKVLSGLTTRDDLIKILGKNASERVENDAVIIFLQFEGGDAGIQFTLIKGRLSKFHYWIPC